MSCTMSLEAQARRIVDAFVEFAYGKGYSNANVISLHYVLISQAALTCEEKNYFLQNSTWEIKVDGTTLCLFVYIFPTTNPANPNPCNGAPAVCPGGGGCGTCKYMVGGPVGTGYLCPTCLLEESDLSVASPIDGVTYNFRDPEEPPSYSCITKAANSPYVPGEENNYEEDGPSVDIACMLDAFQTAPDTGSLDSEFVDCLRTIDEALCCHAWPCFLLLEVINYWTLDIEGTIIPRLFFALQMYFPHFSKPYYNGVPLEDFCYKRDFVFEDILSPIEEEKTDFQAVVRDWVTNFNTIQEMKLRALIEMQGINVQQQNEQQETSEHIDVDVNIVPENKSEARYSFAVDILKKAVSFLSG